MSSWEDWTYFGLIIALFTLLLFIAICSLWRCFFPLIHCRICLRQLQCSNPQCNNNNNRI